MKGIDTSVSLGSLALKNPVMTASGTCGYGLELDRFLDLSRLGALVVKGLSILPRTGNPPPRIIETASGMLNSIGLENVGMEAFVEQYLPRLRAFDTPLVVNILGETEAEYGELAERLGSQEGIHAIEVNVSCPNVRKGGITFGADPSALTSLIRSLRGRTAKPLIVKLSPNVTDVVDMAKRVEAAGADALTLINTLRGMSVDAESRRPHLSTCVGGLSGPAIKPVALRIVWEVSREVTIPVIGAGGICDGLDAVEFLLCGASAVQVGTAAFRNPTACLDVLDGVVAYLERHETKRLRDLIGGLRTDG